MYGQRRYCPLKVRCTQKHWCVFNGFKALSRPTNYRKSLYKLGIRNHFYVFNIAKKVFYFWSHNAKMKRFWTYSFRSEWYSLFLNVLSCLPFKVRCSFAFSAALLVPPECVHCFPETSLTNTGKQKSAENSGWREATWATASIWLLASSTDVGRTPTEIQS